MNGDEQPYQRPDRLASVPEPAAPAGRRDACCAPWPAATRPPSPGSTTWSRRASTAWPAACCATRRRPRRWRRRCWSRCGARPAASTRPAARPPPGSSPSPTAGPWTGSAPSRRRRPGAADGRRSRRRRPHDEVVEQATARLERQQVRRCLKTSPTCSGEAITLAYYGGYTYREVAELLRAGLPTVKTRMRDGLIRLRDCLGVEVAAMSRPRDIHSLAGAVRAARAGRVERADVRSGTCAGARRCAAEVAELRETAARLADDAWSVPPPRAARRGAGRGAPHPADPAGPAGARRSAASPPRWWRHPCRADHGRVPAGRGAGRRGHLSRCRSSGCATSGPRRWRRSRSWRGRRRC